jgi:hypothetical protein
VAKRLPGRAIYSSGSENAMATKVGLAVLMDTPTRFIVATFPDTSTFWKRAWGNSLPDPSSPPIESWDFDCGTGTLIITTVKGPEAEPTSTAIPLASLTALRLGGVEATNGSEGYTDYELRLTYDDGSPLGRMVSLPGSDDFLSSWQNEIRSIESRLRGFLKPVCPKLEGTLLEELGKWFTMGHAGRVQYLNEKVGKLQAALTVISQSPHRPGMDPSRWQEQLQVFRDKLGQAGASSAPDPGQPDSPPVRTGPHWLLRALLAFVAGMILFYWMFPRK